MPEDPASADEARRIAQHASIKTQIEGNVNSEIKGRAAEGTTAHSERVGAVADEFRGRALAETLASEHDVARSRGAARLSQYVDYGFYVLYALLGIRLALSLIAARSASGFVQFINAITFPFYVPFRGIVASPRSEEGFTLALPVAIAILVYALLHLAVKAMLRIAAHRKTAL